MSALKKLDILIRITEILNEIQEEQGFLNSVTGVYRGRNRFGTEVKTPFLALLEAPRADIADYGNQDHTISKDEWTILVQGFAKDDPFNPSDEAYRLLADVETHLSKINQTRCNGMTGGQYPQYFRLGGLIADMQLDQPVVRPAEENISPTAFFYLPVRFTLVRDIQQH